MWALRRAANPLRIRGQQIVSARGCANLEALQNADVKSGERHHQKDCWKVNCFHDSKPSAFQSAFTSSPFMWSRNLSSQAGAKSGDNVDDLEDGFSDLEVPPEADKGDEELTSEESSDADSADTVGLLDLEADEKPEKVLSNKASHSALFKVVLEAPRQGVAGALQKFVRDGTLERSDVFFTILHLRKRRLFLKALQLLEWLEEAKQFDLGERDYASRLDLIAKVHGLFRAEKYILEIPASHRGEIVYRTFLANCVVAVNVKKAEEIFNRMKDLGLPITIFACNQLLLLYKRVDRKKIADVLKMMEKENVKPSLFTYKLLIDTKGSAKEIEDMEKVIETMKAEGVEPDLLGQATIAKHYIFAGHLEKAEGILELMEGDDIKENRAACKVVLPLYAFLGKADDVERIWKVCEPCPRLDECLSGIEAFGRLGNIEKAEKIFEDMFKTWKTLSSKYYNALLRMYAHKNLLSKGKDLVKRMSDDGHKIGDSTLDSLVRLYVNAGEVEKADSILQKLSQQNRIRPLYSTYIMVLENYAKRGDIHNAEKMFSKLRQMGYTGRIKQFQVLLQAYVHAKAPAYGFRERMRADNIFPNNTLSTLLAATDAFKKTPLSELLD